jgi:ribosome biogenesis protein BRX1
MAKRKSKDPSPKCHKLFKSSEDNQKEEDRTTGRLEAAKAEKEEMENESHDSRRVDEDRGVLQLSEEDQAAAVAQTSAEDEDDNDDGNEDSGEEISIEPEAIQSDGRYRNKQRCLVLCSRGVTARYRHLLEDLRTLMPHHKKESKLDPGDTGMGRAVNDIAAMKSCTSVLFLECRKRQDAYMWLGRVGGQSPGPSVKFHVSNIHTMDELRLTGNCMKGSRPILSFDESFGRVGHLRLLKELFVDVFGTPRGHPKSKPFVDRVMAFYYADKRVRSLS